MAVVKSFEIQQSYARINKSSLQKNVYKKAYQICVRSVWHYTALPEAYQIQ